MNKRQSLFHIAKRDTLPWYQAVLIRGGAIVLALIVCAIVTTLLTGENPIKVYSTILYGAFGTSRKSWVTFHNLAILLGISLAPVLDQEPTGQTVAFFYITTSGAVNVRKSGDYIAKAIRMAGGEYVSFDESGEENALSTMTIQMESFYDTALDADVLIYNSTIDGGITSIDELLAKSPLFADFKAVQTGNVWCITKNFYQESLALGDMILDVHAVLNNPDAADLRFLKKLS